MRERALEGDLLIVSKTNRLSTVHRRVRMDYVGVRKIAHDGRVAGEARMLGLFTSKAYAEPASQTPLLNRKLRQILRHEDLIEGSHDYKAAVALFDSFPKDELFSARTDDLRRAVVELLSLEGDRVRLLGRRASDGRSVSLIAALPAVALRRRAARRASPRCCASASAPTPSTPRPCWARASASASTSRCTRPAACPTSRCASSSRSSSRSPARGTTACASGSSTASARRAARELAARWAPRFPEYYRASVDPALVVGDVELLRAAGDARASRSSSGCRTRPGRTRVALYKTGGKVELGEAMPTLEDLGLRVVEEVPTRLLGGDGETWVQDFGVLGPGDRPLDLAAVGDRVADMHRGRAPRRRRVGLAQPARARWPG